MKKYSVGISDQLLLVGCFFICIALIALTYTSVSFAAETIKENDKKRIAKVLADIDIPEVELEIEEKEPPEKEDPIYIRTANVPTDIDTSFKAYMDFTTITDTNSRQYDIQQKAYTDENGLRKVGEYYCVALGTGIAEGIGSKFEITLDSGNTFKAILADQKADIHTDESNRYVEMSEGRGNLVEFIVETEAMPDMVKVMGDVDHMTDGIFSGNIVSIKELAE